jgi:hypothetical protein
VLDAIRGDDAQSFRLLALELERRSRLAQHVELSERHGLTVFRYEDARQFYQAPVLASIDLQ